MGILGHAFTAIVIVLLVLAGQPSAVLSAQATVSGSVFVEDFESDLSQWVGRGGGGHNGIMVVDPLNPTNHCLTFTATTNTADLLGLEIPTAGAPRYQVSFDFLGFPEQDGIVQPLGGFIAVVSGDGGNGISIAGTCYDNNIQVLLVCDGSWHSYTVSFDPSVIFPPPYENMRIMVEDWDGAASLSCPGGTPGGSLFDNIVLAPEGSVPGDTRTWGGVKALYR